MVSPAIPEGSFNSMLYGIDPKSKALFPISDHTVGKIFDAKKVEEYFKQPGNTISQTDFNFEEIKGESLLELSSDFGTKLSFQGGANYGAACFSGCLSGEFQDATKSSCEKKFAQIRKYARWFTLILPTAAASLRKLLDKDFSERLDSIKDEKTAENFLKTEGLFFVQKGHYGGLVTFSSSLEKTAENKKVDLSSAISAEVSCIGTGNAKTSASFSLGSNLIKKNENISIFIAAVGGEPTLLLEGSLEKWQNSAATKVAMVGATFMPIYLLATDEKIKELLKKKTESMAQEREKAFNDLVKRIDEAKKAVDKNEDEVLYYYFRSYGNNYPILYRCSKYDYDTNKDVYNGKDRNNGGQYGGLYLNYNKLFLYTSMTIPSMTYCHDNYFYHYGETTYGKMAKLIGNITPTHLREILE